METQLRNGANKNSGPKHTGAIFVPNPSSGRILYIPLFLQGSTAWEGQVLLTGLNMLKKVKAQPLGFKKRTQQWPELQWCPKPGWKNLVKTDYYMANSICCLSNKLLKQMHWLCNYTCRNFKHQENTKTLLVFQFFKVSWHLSCYEFSRVFSCTYPT